MSTACADNRTLRSGLLKDAMLRTLQAADIAGIRAMAVHAKDDDARAFSERSELPSQYLFSGPAARP